MKCTSRRISSGFFCQWRSRNSPGRSPPSNCPRGAEKLLESEFTLGGEASAVAGPVGRTVAAQTDAQLRADILSWSRSQGLFAGIALQGATLRQDLDDNATLYGKRIENRDIVRNGASVPQAAEKLIALLDGYSARERAR